MLCCIVCVGHNRFALRAERSAYNTCTQNAKASGAIYWLAKCWMCLDQVHVLVVGAQTFLDEINTFERRSFLLLIDGDANIHLRHHIEAIR